MANLAACVNVITKFYEIIPEDRSCAPRISRNRFATMSDHACTVRKRVCRTTSAPVSTTRTPQDPATRRTRANISTAIRLTSQWIRPAAITPYVMHTCICVFFYNFICRQYNTLSWRDSKAYYCLKLFKASYFYCGMASVL